MSVRIAGIALPSDEAIDLTIVDGLWSDEYSLDLDQRIEGWIIPGLVDVHTHPGADKPGQLIDEKLLRTQLTKNIDNGVTAIRSPGLASNPPEWFGNDPDLPRAFHAGPWLAQPGQFITGWGRRVSNSDFPRTAAAQAAATGWCKIIADWGIDDEAISQEVMSQIAQAVHAVGGRVAVHSQNEAGSTAAVRAGVDSLEHGMWLDKSLLDLMAAQGTALVPTMKVFSDSVGHFQSKEPSPKRDWYVEGTRRHPGLINAAYEAGVPILAGTDSAAFSVSEEVKELAAAGLSPADAIGAASWLARDFLGLSAFVPGAPADAVIYREDPRKNLDILDFPDWVILRGKILRRPGIAS